MGGIPARNSISADLNRLTVNEDPRKRNRNPRDKEHQGENINILMNFLSFSEYDRPFSHSILSNPSLKDFQSIFRHILSFIDPSAETGKRFEDEVSFFLKSIKYPYTAEINRSQLIAITPHTWPVLLSMLGWLVKLVNSIYEIMENPEEKEGTKKIFYEFLYKEYANYMEGIDETNLEESLEKEIANQNKEKIRIAEEKKEKLKRIKEEIKAQNTTNDLEEIKEKHRQTTADLEKIGALRKNQEIKNKNYKAALEESAKILRKLKEESGDLYVQKTALEEEIKIQPIRPEDIQEMTQERDYLIKSLEEIKRSKTILIREIDIKNQKIKTEVEEAEALMSNIKKIKTDLRIKISKKKTNTDLLEYEEYSVDGNIAEEEVEAKERLEHLQKEIERLEACLEAEKEKNMHLHEVSSSLKDEIEQKEERVKVHAQVYIEKKEATEEEYKMTVGRVDKAETELLKILAEGDNGLFQSEQSLERVKIRRGRILSRISVEEAEIQKVSAIVDANVNSLKERIEESVKILSISQ